MTFMYEKQAAVVAVPLISADWKKAARVLAAIALTAATIWCASWAVSLQDEQQKIHEFQLGYRPQG